MKNNLPRVVQVGFNKCATRSLANLFTGSGHASAHHKFKPLLGRNRNIAVLMRANQEAGRRMFHGFEDYVFYADLMVQTRSETYEAFKDFRQILADYPDTIFLLNVRNRENWIQSRLKHGHGTFVEMVRETNRFSNRQEVVECWRRDWDTHLSDVRGFMGAHPGQLVEFDTDRESVETLVARLPDYRLDPDAWGEVGRSRGRRQGTVMRRLRALNARRKMRQ